MKIVIIGGRGTAIVIGDQINDAHNRFGMDIEMLGLALDDHSGGDDVSGYPILCDIKDAYAKYEKYANYAKYAKYAKNLRKCYECSFNKGLAAVVLS